jgi:hypothetical protein
MQISIRRLMIAIAVFTMALDIGLSYRLSPSYRRQAAFFARTGQIALVRAGNVESGWLRLEGYSDAQKKKAADQARQFADWCTRMKWKYHRASLLPWLPLARDPAPP